MNEEQFAKQIEEIKLQLYKTAYLYLGNEVSAMEAVDETVYQALKSLKKLRQLAYFKTWITRILINECKKELKRMARLYPDLYLPDLESENGHYDNLPLKEAIANLPEKLRTVIILRFLMGYTLMEVANILEIPQGTVVTYQRRALKLLKLDLMEVDEDESKSGI